MTGRERNPFLLSFFVVVLFCVMQKKSKIKNQKSKIKNQKN